MLFSGNNQSLKALYIINSENVRKGSQTVGFIFHKLRRSRISTKCILKGMKACCAQAFATVLAIRSEISEEQCLKRISDLVRNRMVLLRLGSDNSCPTIRLNEKLNDDHVFMPSLCICMYMKDLVNAEATIQKQLVNERHLPGYYFHFR